jgi:hypothetical protein
MQPKNAVSVNPLLFSAPQKLLVGYTQKPVFPFCGLLFIARFFNGLTLAERLFQIIPHKPTSPLAYNVGELLVGFVAAVFCGMQRLSHYFRNIPKDVVAQIMESSGTAAHFVTIGRVFKRILNETELQQFRDGIWEILRGFLVRLTLTADWLVFDSTVLTRYGKQEKAEKGYNPSKPGRKSHHPLIASLCEQGFILDIVNRPGKATASSGIEELFARTLVRAQTIGVRVLGVLADAGFYDETFLLTLEAALIPYIVVARFYSTLKNKVLGLSASAWKAVDDGIEIAEFQWKHAGWTKERRYIVIRRDTDKCPDAVGKKLERHEQLALPGLEKGAQYRYSCFVTSLPDEAVQVWRQYRRRIMIERQIEDLTYDLGLKKLNTKKWVQTTAMLTMLMFAYNLYHLFAQTALPKKDRVKKLSTIRSELFMVGGVIGRSGRDQVLRLSLAKRSFRRRIEYLFIQIEQAVARLTGNCPTMAANATINGARNIALVT